MVKVSCAVNNLMGQLFPNLPYMMVIDSEWNNIVGDELIGYAELVGIKLGSDNNLCVIVEILSSSGILLMHNCRTIRDRISILTGYDIAKINLILKQVSVIGKRMRNAA